MTRTIIDDRLDFLEIDLKDKYDTINDTIKRINHTIDMQLDKLREIDIDYELATARAKKQFDEQIGAVEKIIKQYSFNEDLLEHGTAFLRELKRQNDEKIYSQNRADYFAKLQIYRTATAAKLKTLDEEYGNLKVDVKNLHEYLREKGAQIREIAAMIQTYVHETDPDLQRKYRAYQERLDYIRRHYKNEDILKSHVVDKKCSLIHPRLNELADTISSVKMTLNTQ